MKKITVLLKQIAFLLLMGTVNQFSIAQVGLPWSDDCSLKPSRYNTVVAVYSGPNEVTTSSIYANLASLDNSNLRVLIFPGGSYTINQTINIQSNVVLKGSSNTVFNIYTNVGVVISNAIQSGIEGITFNNYFTISPCDPSGNSMFSVKLVDSHHCWVKSVSSNSGGPSGHIQIRNSYENEISGCTIYGTRDGGDASGGRGYGINLVDAYNNLIQENTVGGVRHHILLYNNSHHNMIRNNKTYFTYATNSIGCGVFDSRYYLPTLNSFNSINVIWGQIEFHGADSGIIGPGDNTITGNSVEGYIHYYKQSGKTNNRGNDNIYNNNSRVSSCSIQTYNFIWGTSCLSSNDPDNPVQLSNNYVGNPNAQGNNISTPSINCSLDLSENTPIVTNVQANPCIEMRRRVTNQLVSSELGSIYIQLVDKVGAFPISVNIDGVPAEGSPFASSWIYIPNVSCGSHTLEITDANGRATPNQNITINTVVYYIGRNQEMRDNGSQDNANFEIEKEKEGVLEYTNLSTSPVRAKFSNIKNTNNAFKILTYPNPANSQITIEYNIDESDVISIQLLNSVGQIVKIVDSKISREAGNYVNKVDINNLGSGMYYGVIKGESSQQTFKVVIQ